MPMTGMRSQAATFEDNGNTVDIYTDNQQLRDNRGYNHCYILKEQPSRDMVLAACLCEPASKRRLTVMTDLPGVLLYTAGYYEFPDTAVWRRRSFRIRLRILISLRAC